MRQNEIGFHTGVVGSCPAVHIEKGWQPGACCAFAGELFEWVTHTQSTMSAFYEFDFFISEYLLYMRRKYPAGYQQLRSYSRFSEAYSTLRNLYTDLIDSYLQKINSEMDRLNGNGGSEVSQKDGWLWVRSGESHISSGTPLFSDERRILLPVLESKRFREIREPSHRHTVIPFLL